ncbi:oligosaccharide flippase family protein [Variovorax sp. J2P1-59]|uniref:oligosaccharide flippase family protein n=1 Tax=Variovorax flavidus TaxID=3053501 RepID=UPI002577E722|nr:oligosaccharide flippase family protein [Variovorax sp. J2P1-59]MDM0075153.1 oligosaccharide flippase family protein [Variovorax sp. J2P1-59]
MSLLTRNIASLGFFQVASHLIALASVPFMARVLGVSSFGEFVLTQAAMRYCILFVDFGFLWSATRQIAASRASEVQVSAIFSRTWVLQWLLVAIVAVLLATLLLCIPALRPSLWLCIAGFSMVIGSAAAPTWLLLGLERMNAVAISQGFANLLALVLLFVFVDGPGDVALALVIYGGALAATNATLTWWILRKGLVRWSAPSRTELLQTAKDGFPVFVSTIFVSFYTVLPALAVGALSSATAAAYFNVADKARAAATSAMQPAFTALLPRMSHLFVHDRRGARILLRRSIVATAGVSGAASIVLFFGAELIVNLVGGQSFVPATSVLKWMSPLPFVVSMSSIASLQILLPNQKIKQFNGVLMMAGAVSLASIWPFVQLGAELGAAQCLLLTELLVCAAMWRFAILTVLRKDP